MRARGILCLRLAPPVARTFQGRCTGVLAARALVDILQPSVDNVSQPPSTGYRLDLGGMSVRCAFHEKKTGIPSRRRIATLAARLRLIVFTETGCFKTSAACCWAGSAAS